MAIYFIDSSALVKRYIDEVGSKWIDSLLGPAANNPVYVSAVTAVEVVSAVVRRQRVGEISTDDARRAVADFRDDLATQYGVVEITATLIAQAVALVQRHGLGAYDAVQLAAAMQLRAGLVAAQLDLVFVSSDSGLNASARAEGLVCEDPNSHP